MRHYGQLVLALALLVAIAAATPSWPLRSSRRTTFSAKQVTLKVPAQAHSGWLAKNKALRKYGHAPTRVQTALKKKGKGSKLATPKDKDANDSTEKATPDEQDTQYICEVSVAGNKYRLNFDTGSSDL